MTSALEESTPGNVGRIKAVCLDIDDTLLDSERSSRRAFAALTGNDAAWPVWRRITDEYHARMMAGEIDFTTMCRRRTHAFFAAFGERLDEADVIEREQRRMAAMQRSWELFDDATNCLEWLRASGLRLAVITNAPGEYQRRKIASLGVGGFFDELVISGEHGVAKPNGGIFRIACAALGYAPHEVAHVGDSFELDARGAARAGMHGVWLNRGGRVSLLDGTATDDISVITALHELPELLVCDVAPPSGVEAHGAHEGAEVFAGSS